jgi:hypothetical protein
LIKHYVLLFEVSTHIVVAFHKPYFNGGDSVGTLLGAEGGKSIIEIGRVLIANGKDVDIAAKVRRKSSSKGYVLINLEHIWKVISLIKSKLHIERDINRWERGLDTERFHLKMGAVTNIDCDKGKINVTILVGRLKLQEFLTWGCGGSHGVEFQESIYMGMLHVLYGIVKQFQKGATLGVTVKETRLSAVFTLLAIVGRN